MGHADTHRRLHELFNARDFDGMDQHLGEGIVYEDVPRGLTMKNREEFKDWVRDWPKAFSDARVEEASYLDGPTFSLARFRGRGVNDGAFGPMPATGKQMDNPFWELFEYDADGRAVGGGIHYDQVTILTQLGHITPPA